MAERKLLVSAENGLHAQASAKAAGPGREIIARAEGEDADEALDALEALFLRRFED
jgi:phosphotransferase system HPr-like phosphotransfer protein